MNNQNNHDDEKYLSKHEVADFLRKSIPTINNYMKREGMPYYRVGRSVLFRENEVNEWVSRHERTKVK